MVKLLALAMARAGEVMEANVVWFGGHVFVFGLFVGFLAHACTISAEMALARANTKV